MPIRIRTKQFTAISALFALALGSTIVVAPTPAHADKKLRNLAIGAGIAIIANEISKGSKSKQPKKTVRKSTKKKKVVTGPRATIGTFKTTKNEVFDYQTRLNKLGFNTGAPDGSVGKNTRAGVRAFQASLGNEQTGRLTEVEAARLKILTDVAAPKTVIAGAPKAPASTVTKAPASNVMIMAGAIPLPPSMQSASANQEIALAAPDSDTAITLELFNVDSQENDFSLTESGETFDILQVRTGDAMDAALNTLAAEGVSNCQRLGGVALCSMHDNPEDKIALRSTPDALGVDRVTTIARHMKFDPALPEAYLTSMLEENYTGLVSAPGQTMGTQGCSNSVGPDRISGAQIYETLMGAGHENLVEIATGCKSFARLSMDGPQEGEVSDLFIVLFDGANLPTEEKEPAGLAKIKF